MKSNRSFVRDTIKNIKKFDVEFHWTTIYDLVPDKLKNKVDRATINKYISTYSYYSDDLVRVRPGYYRKTR